MTIISQGDHYEGKCPNCNSFISAGMNEISWTHNPSSDTDPGKPFGTDMPIVYCPCCSYATEMKFCRSKPINELIQEIADRLSFRSHPQDSPSPSDTSST